MKLTITFKNGDVIEPKGVFNIGINLATVDTPTEHGFTRYTWPMSEIESIEITSEATNQ